MELQPGWYKVKLDGKWFCAYYDGIDFALVMPDYGRVWYGAEDLDQIGDKIEFPNE